MLYDYELFTIFPGTLAESELPEQRQKVQELLEKYGAKDIREKDMGKSRLAYPIKHIRYGYFVRFYFQATGEDIQEIQQKLALLPQLLRRIIRRHDGTVASDEAQEVLKEFSHLSNKKSQKSSGKEKKKSETKNTVPEKETETVKEEPKQEKEEEKEEALVPAKTEAADEAPLRQGSGGQEEAAEEAAPEEEKKVVSMEEIEQKLDDILEKSL